MKRRGEEIVETLFRFAAYIAVGIALLAMALNVIAVIRDA